MKSPFKTDLKRLVIFTIILILVAGVTQAANMYQVSNLATSQINEWGVCGNINNQTGKALFVPTGSSAEWLAFRNHLPPNVTNTSCVVCDPGTGNACNSSPNSCGQTGAGTIQCDGSCSASVPSDPAGYGNMCNSSPNSCGQTNIGSIDCSGNCSASTPSDPAGYGNMCNSSPNSCGQTNIGSIDCSGNCSATIPPDSSCPPTLTCVVGTSEPANVLGIQYYQGQGTRVQANQSSADFACQQMGYMNATSYTTQGWSSCGDNWYAYANGGTWGHVSGCDPSSGINYINCYGEGSVCQNVCGNNVVDPGESCDGNDSEDYTYCGDPTWTCSSNCTKKYAIVGGECN
ncbi:MAG: hypothetical protein WCV82_01420 [Candidatus Paceibacterota bacterium]